MLQMALNLPDSFYKFKRVFSKQYFHAEISQAVTRRCDVTLRAVWKVGTRVTAGSFTG